MSGDERGAFRSLWLGWWRAFSGISRLAGTGGRTGWGFNRLGPQWGEGRGGVRIAFDYVV